MKPEMKFMKIGSIFDNAFRMSFGKFKEVLRVTLLFFLFLTAIAVITLFVLFILFGWGMGGLSRLAAFSHFFSRFSQSVLYDQFENIIEKIGWGPLIIISLSLFIILLLADIIYNGILNHLFLQTFRGDEWKLSKSISVVWKRTGALLFSILPITGIFIAFIFGAALVIGILSVLMSIIGMFVSISGVVIFGFYGAVVLEMVGPIIIDENLSGGKAVTRAFILANYNIMGVAGAYILYVIMSFVLSIIFASAFGFLIVFLRNFGGLSIAVNIIYVIFYVLLTLFIGAIGRALVVTIFYNLKIKNEGFGVESLVHDYVEGQDLQDEDKK